MTYKMVMVGIVGVGKKSLMRRFGGAEFSSSEISKMTSHFVSSDIDRFIIKTWDDSVRLRRRRKRQHHVM
jgi:GTPase SAR1 family protein